MGSKLRVSVTVSDQDHKLLSAFAREHSVSVAWVARQALVEFINRHVHEGTQLPLVFNRPRGPRDEKK